MAVRYQVTSTNYAQHRLADLWTQAQPGERSAITAASDGIDNEEFRQDADLKGEPVNPLSPDLRLIEVHPLRAYFEVSVDDRRVFLIEYELIIPEA